MESRWEGGTKRESQIKFFMKNKHCPERGGRDYLLGARWSEVAIPTAWNPPKKRHCVPGTFGSARGKQLK